MLSFTVSRRRKSRRSFQGVKTRQWVQASRVRVRGRVRGRVQSSYSDRWSLRRPGSFMSMSFIKIYNSGGFRT
jgi:hypothetical protein